MAMPAAGSPSRCFVAERADLVLARRALAGGARRKRREAGRRHRVSRGVALLASIGGPMTGRDDTSDAKRRLRSGGWYVRYTEWPSGHQVVLHRRSDTAVHLVTRWCPTEADAFEEALALAERHEARGGRLAPPAEAAGRERGASSDGHARSLDVVFLGNAREDLVIRTRRLPAAGEALEGDVLAREPGGKAIRQAMAAARLGARVGVIARVGGDAHGDEIVARLRAEGIRAEHVARDPDARTGLGLVHEDRSGRRSTATVSQATSATASVEDVGASEDLLQHASVLVASLETSPECIAEAFRIAHRHGTHAILDADPERKVPDRLLRLANIAIVATRSTRGVTGASVTGRRSVLVAARSLLRRVSGGAVVLTTRGAALLLTRNDEIWVPEPHRERSGIPEARDAFCAAFAVALAEDADLARAGRLATAAAALASPRAGEPARLPTRSEVTAFASELRGGEELTLDGILPADAPEASGDPRA